MNDRILFELHERGLMSGLLNTNETWIAVAYVVCMFAVGAFRPQQIGNPAYFRMSYIMFGLYFVLPALANAAIWWVFNIGQGGFGNSANMSQFGVGAVTIVAPLLAKVCLGVSIILALSSLRHTLYMAPPYRDS